MALTPSTILPLGTIAPDFELSDAISDKLFSLQDLKSDVATVVMFICNHCPFVIHIQNELVRFVKQYQQKNISFIAINANDSVSYPDDSPFRMKQVAKEKSYCFPYLFDESQEVAKAYQAACTPEFYLFDADLKCVYHGQFDEARPNNDVPVTGDSLAAAISQLLAGKPLDIKQKPSIGCNIKWKK